MRKGVGRGWQGAGAAMLLALAACGGPARLDGEKAWVRLPAVPGRPAAAYFTLNGGPQDERLINVSADLAIRAEMHATMRSGAMSGMKPLAEVAIPAHTDVAFAPGGRHVMLFDVDPGVKPGGSMMLTYSFADGQRLRRRAIVVGAADPAPQW